MKVIFKKIYIFDILTKRAFVTNFEEGLNIVTSSRVDGTDRGKSVLLRSLYHTLGADSHFDKKWKNNDKVYLLKFLIDDKVYFIYRHKNIFKVFDNILNILFQTSSRSELAKFLGESWSFKILLPNRDTGKLEIAPPVYTYVMNFIDQDHYEGTKFSSFRSLEQYKDFKADVIYSQFGIYDNCYFEHMKNKQELLDSIKESEVSYKKVDEIKEKVSNLLGSIIVPENIEELEIEISIRSKEYDNILNSMNETRCKITNLRNEKYELEVALRQIEKLKKNKEKEIKIILKKDVCPECNTILSDTIDLRSKRYNSIEDSIYIRDSIYEDITKVKREIIKLENKYMEFSNKLEIYKKEIGLTKKEIKNYTAYMGLNELYNKLNGDLYNEFMIQSELNDRLENIDKELNELLTQKADVNKKYKQMIDHQLLKFNLNEIEETQYKTIKNKFCASGSNRPISTVIWYFVLNNLRKLLNKNQLQLPMVLDSPKNAEMDDYKEKALIEYILENSSNYSQMIFSSIGFEKNKIDYNDKIKIIELENNKYELLNFEDYIEYQGILETTLNSQLI